MIGSSLAVERHTPLPVESQMDRYLRVRGVTESLAEPLAVEDYVVQSMPDVSPTKWHLAHVTWFFETFVLMDHLAGYQPLDPAYQFLFNSYYLGAGERHCRDQRGYISRPTVKEVYEYRRHVDEHMVELLTNADRTDEVSRVLEIGLQHEQQHQELLLTDIKHVLSVNPLRPAYHACDTVVSPGDEGNGRGTWVEFPEGLFEVGAAEGPFSFDNERPRHRFFVDAFELADRPVTNAQYLEFLDDGGYERGEFWLSEGWSVVQDRGWREPFYWERRDGAWHTFTMAGLEPLDLAQPVCHITYFEAEAYAQWAGARLPSEQEWEVASRTGNLTGNFADTGRFHPRPAGIGAAPGGKLRQMFGDVWEWTRSQYSPYPGYQPLPGTLGEYNGKFMSNQFVLRGGSCATPADHIRPTYRNFFPADAAWQFSGVRLARDV
ncbi:MAG: ergothioneine biosynthesis protein EgtB [Longimicrobiales bacterium]